MIPTLVRQPGKRSRRHVLTHALAKGPDMLEVGHRPVPSCSPVKPAPLMAILGASRAAGASSESSSLEVVMATEAAVLAFKGWPQSWPQTFDPSCVSPCGARRDRTADLLHAMESRVETL